MCKKRLLLLTLSFLSLVTVLCPLAAQDAADIVVLMDTSGTVLPWFDQIHTRVLPDITRRFIRQGDTVHLISFNARVNLELVQPIENEADISRVVSRFMLLYPLGKNSDFLSGLKYSFSEYYVFYSCFKMAFFSFMISTISAYKGFYAAGGALGVGRSSTKSIVISCILILMFDLIITQLMLY